MGSMVANPWRGGHFQINGQGYSWYILGVKKVVLVALRVFSLKRSTLEALEVPFRYRAEKI